MKTRRNRKLGTILPPPAVSRVANPQSWENSPDNWPLHDIQTRLGTAREGTVEAMAKTVPCLRAAAPERATPAWCTEFGSCTEAATRASPGEQRHSSVHAQMRPSRS